MPPLQRDILVLKYKEIQWCWASQESIPKSTSQMLLSDPMGVPDTPQANHWLVHNHYKRFKLKLNKEI